ncbi:TetR/AcrR family transcriptional regulator [Clavibacter nebraskensis]|uniref:Transcriptional regulator, TetR family n=1 Tax=Clavibacter nebraskensis NCPPB 2581 TaxID=1097677 RepID=A0AAI9EHY2_9MICO|nr:TetR/AcrR family transcriptional regulator [Clavibacter nebraskensis]KXU22046.1 TetR family transcriptional regulator [Clavibacter nebraskensis]OAH18696.1 TetR family transcriptional regulator [Clavibacter nebraskensis]QGV65728.1 TetR family transcriptional regulator [Clavibacter nebraskensis]QGV68523.1 TetR family transcriptional regulator [Clavibacter nebraskensis]QGV71314.1 TetR family transcriptional regulator [Clavibacter nebraskensis]
MHSVTTSATGLRERRRAETSARLTTLARRLTAERGLSGFTVEEVCDEAGVSRRTFFNYFASKEDALFGRSAHVDTADLEEAFVAAGDPRDPALSPTLLDDLAELCLERWARLDTDGTSMQDMHAAFRREPGLLVRALEAAMEDEAKDVLLVERREGLPPGDLRASVVVQTMGSLGRASAREFLVPGNADSIQLILRRRLDALREIAHPTTVTTRQHERTP